MPPKMNRQNAFTDEQEVFKDIACRICYQSEACGEWKRITCQCTIINDYYLAHEFCLQRLRRCKVCSTLFIEQKPPPIPRPPNMLDKIHAFIVLHYKSYSEILYNYRYRIAIGVIFGLCLLTSFDLFQCTTIEKIDQNDLPELTSDYLWLPVFDVKCFKSRTSFYLTSSFFNIYFLITLCISSIFYYFQYVKK